MNQYRVGLDLVAPLPCIGEAQWAPAAMSSPQAQETAQDESLERFLARLPSLWGQGQTRPMHRQQVCPARHQMTRGPL